MKRYRKQRLDKKLHKWYLGLGVIDASTNPAWRERLIHTPYHQALPIDAEHLEGIYKDVAAGIRKYRLQYAVAKVHFEFQPYDGNEDCVMLTFRFWARRYPDITSTTYNFFYADGTATDRNVIIDLSMVQP